MSPPRTRNRPLEELKRLKVGDGPCKLRWLMTTKRDRSRKTDNARYE